MGGGEYFGIGWQEIGGWGMGCDAGLSRCGRDGGGQAVHGLAHLREGRRRSIKGQTVRHLELKSGGDLTGVLSYRSHVAASRQTISKFRNVSKFTSQFIKPEMTARSLVIKIRFLQDSHEFKRI